MNLRQLPVCLNRLNLYKNHLSGSVDLRKLPVKMTKLYLNSNAFTGPVDLTSLPDGMKRLRLDRNKFSGEGVFRETACVDVAPSIVLYESPW